MSGPMMRLTFIIAVLRAIAFISRSRGTSVATSACRAGMLNAKAAPVAIEMINRCQNWMTSVMIRTATMPFTTTRNDCATRSSLRRSTRSVTTPAIGESRSIGIATIAMMNPR